MSTIVKLVLIAALVMISPTVQAAVLTVGSGGTYATIEAAIAAAGAGDEVRVIDGATYTPAANLNVNGITLSSVPAGATIQGVITVLDGAGGTVKGFNMTFGRAISVYGTGTSNIEDVTIDCGLAYDQAVYIDNAATVNMTNVTIKNVKYHGIICVGAATLNMTNCTIDNCDDVDMRFDALGTLNMTDCVVKNAQYINLFFPGGCGAAVANLTRCQLATQDVMHGILVNPAASNKGLTINLEDCEIVGGGGIGVVLSENVNFNATGTTFHNIAYDAILVNGTADQAYGNNMTLTGCTIENNGRQGIWLQSAPNVTLTDTTIRNNNDVGIHMDPDYAYEGSLTIDHCVIKENGIWQIMRFGDAANSPMFNITRSKFSSRAGGTNAVVSLAGAPAGSQFVNNLVDHSAGGTLLELYKDDIKVWHNTLVDFGATPAASGIALVEPSTYAIDIRNNLIQGPVDGITGSGTMTDLSGVTIDYNLVNVSGTAIQSDFSSVAGPGNVLDMAATFVSTSATPGAGDYRYSGAGSAGIGMGIDLGVAVDLDNVARPRPSGSNPDLGCYESYLIPVELSEFSVE